MRLHILNDPPREMRFIPVPDVDTDGAIPRGDIGFGSPPGEEERRRSDSDFDESRGRPVVSRWERIRKTDRRSVGCTRWPQVRTIRCGRLRPADPSQFLAEGGLSAY